MNLVSVLRTVSCALAVATAAILGVATRAFLNPLFNSQRVNVTSSFSATFYDLPANLLGCFILGFFTQLKKRFTIHPIIALSFSTGYCGSVTTFASWSYQIAHMFALGDWVDSLFALYFGVALPLTIFVVGQDFSTYLISLVDSRHVSTRHPPTQPALLQSTSRSTGNITTDMTNASSTTTGFPDGYDPEVDLETDPDSDVRSGRASSGPGLGPVVRDGQHRPAALGIAQQGNKTQGQTQRHGRSGGVDLRLEVELESKSDTNVMGMKSAAMVLVVTLVLFCGTFCGAILGALYGSRRTSWASAALGPVGATLRWGLAAAFNRTVHTGGFPLGTFVANVAASVLDFIIGAVRIHRTNLSNELDMFLSAAITGFAGSLSTVSTWINEAVNMTREKKYIYLILTVAVTQVLGVVIYGTAYWVRLAG